VGAVSQHTQKAWVWVHSHLKHSVSNPLIQKKLALPTFFAQDFDVRAA
jgi:hypothetical protein